MKKITTAVIMAAGKSARMFPVSDYVPKPLVKVHNKTLIDHSIEFLTKNGIENIYVTYGYKSEMLVPHIEKKVAGLINTDNKDNSWFLFDSFVKHIDEDILIMPCDIIMDADISTVAVDHTKSKFKHTIVPVNHKEGIGMQADFVCVDSNKAITSIGKTRHSTICASGIQMLNPKFINTICPKFSNWYDVWRSLTGYRLSTISNDVVKSWETYDRLDQLLKTSD